MKIAGSRRSCLLTWLVEEPQLYPRVKQYISVEDFTEELYRKVAERLFEDLDKGEIQSGSDRQSV